jgi:hypothetical protein
LLITHVARTDIFGIGCHLEIEPIDALKSAAFGSGFPDGRQEFLDDRRVSAGDAGSTASDPLALSPTSPTESVARTVKEAVVGRPHTIPLETEITHVGAANYPRTDIFGIGGHLEIDPIDALNSAAFGSGFPHGRQEFLDDAFQIGRLESLYWASALARSASLTMRLRATSPARGPKAAAPSIPPANWQEARPARGVDGLRRHLRQVDRVVRSENAGCGWRVFGAHLGRAGAGLGKDPSRLRPRLRRSGADEDGAGKGLAMPVTP